MAGVRENTGAERGRGALQVLAHADLAHELVLVAVHAGQLADVREGVLQPVRQLERVHVAQPELPHAVHKVKKQKSRV